MKAITICQPYAHLISLPESDPRHKRVENRTWPTRYRGPLLIHAGKSRQWLSADFEGNFQIPLERMVFGAIVAKAHLVACLPMAEILEGRWDREYPWLRDHDHTHGPWCFVLDGVTRLSQPIPYRGAQGLFEVEWPVK